MALIKTGLDIEIKGIKDALSSLGLLDAAQFNLARSSEALIINITGANKVFANISGNVNKLNNTIKPGILDTYAQATLKAETSLTGFSSTVKATVPHLQNIAEASKNIDPTSLQKIGDIKFDNASINAAVLAFDKLEVSFRELNTSISGGLLGALDKLNNIFSANINSNFGKDINDLALGLGKLEKIDTKGSVSDNLAKLISVFQRLSAIQVGGVLTELGTVGPALKSISIAFETIGKTINKGSLEGINLLIGVLRRLTALPLQKTATEIPIFSSAISLLADAFRRFAEGAPGDKLPSALKAVTEALNALFTTFAKYQGKVFDDLNKDMATLAPTLKLFAEGMRKFTDGTNIGDLPTRLVNIKAALLTLRDAFKLKDLDQLAPKLAQLAPALKSFAEAFRNFTIGTNIKNLSTNIDAVIKALTQFVKLKLSGLATDVNALSPGIKSLAEAFRAFTTGVNLDDLPKRITNIVDAIGKLRGLTFGDLSKNLTTVIKPLGEFFTAFRSFGGGEKYSNLGARFNDLNKALAGLKKLNLGQFSKELEGVARGLTILVRATDLIKNGNIDKLSETYKRLRQDTEKVSAGNKILAASYNLLTNPISTITSATKNFATTLIKLPLNIFITQLKVLRAVFINLPLNIIRGAINLLSKAFEILLNTVKSVFGLFTSIGKIFNSLTKTIKGLTAVVKLLLLPFTALVAVLTSFVNVGSKVAGIFTAFKVNQVAADTAKLNQSLVNTNNTLNSTRSNTSTATQQFDLMGNALLKSEQQTRKLVGGLGAAGLAVGAINTAKVFVLANGIAGATQKILAFAAAAKSLQLLGNVFQRISTAISQTTRNIVGAAFNATATFEQLTLQITSLLAKEFVRMGKAGTVQEALGLDELNKTFDETLKVIKKLAIESPFDNTDVVKVYQMANSFGFMREEALDLTTILVDASAALGLSGDDAREVAKVFGQIKSLGKLLAGDVNQLAQRGINVKTILKDVGLSLADFQEGGRDANEAIQIIKDSLVRDFQGAAARATNTLEGLRSTFTSLRDDVLRLTFTPLFDSLKPFAAEVLAPFQTEEFLAKITEMGEILRDNLLGAILAIAKPIVALTTAFINLPEPVKRALAFFAKFAAIAAATSVVIAALQAVMVLIGVSVAFIFNPISVLVGGLIALSAAVVTSRESLAKLFNSIGAFGAAQIKSLSDSIPVLGSALSAILSPLNLITDGFNRFFNRLLPQASSKLDKLNSSLTNVTVPNKINSDFSNVSKAPEKENPIARTLKSTSESVTVVIDKYKELDNQTRIVSRSIGSLNAPVISNTEKLKELGFAVNTATQPLTQLENGAQNVAPKFNLITAAANNAGKQLQLTGSLTKATTAQFNQLSAPLLTTADRMAVIATNTATADKAIKKLTNSPDKLGKALTAVPDIFDKIIINIANAVTFIDTKLTQFGNNVVTVFNGFTTTIQPGITAVQDAFNSLLSIFISVDDTVGSVATSISSTLISAFSGLSKIITGEVGGLGTFFSDFLTQLTGFGSGLINAFADGILGSLNLVADALLEMAKLVTFWLQPNSPPRILPDIDKWGEGLIFAWIDGMVIGAEKGFSGFLPLLETLAKNIIKPFVAIGAFVIGSITNVVELVIGVVIDGFKLLASVGLFVVSQLVLTFSLVANTIGILIDPALTFKDKFIRILNEIGFYFTNTFINISVFAINIVSTILNTLLRLSNFIVKEFIVAFQSIVFVVPSLKTLTSAIADFTKKSLDNLAKFGNTATAFFSKLLKNVTSYGKGLTKAFADGILASVNTVYKALSAIGDLITYWLVPGSPPKLLPNIDKWGTSAANEFLGGFSDADYGKISEFGDLAERVITTAFNAKGIKTDEITFDFKGVYKKFADGLKSGNFSGLSSVIGGIDPDLDRLAKSYVKIEGASKDLAAANDRVAESEKRVADERDKLKSITEAYDAQIAELEGRLTGIEDASTYDAEVKQIGRLQEVIDSRYSSEYEKIQAQREIEKIKTTQQLRALKAQKTINETNLLAAEKQLELDKNAAEGKEKTVSNAEEELNALKSKIQLNEKLNRVESSADKAIKAGPELGDYDPMGVIGAIGDNTITATDNITTAFDSFKNKINEVRDNVQAFFDNIKDKFGKLAEKFKPLTDALGKLFSNTTLVKIAFITLGAVLFGPAIIGGISTILSFFGGLSAILLAISPIVGLVTIGIVGLGAAFVILNANIIEATGLFGEGSPLANGVQYLKDNFGGLAATIQNNVLNAFSQLSSFGKGLYSGLFKSDQNLFDAIFNFDSSNAANSVGNIAAEIAQLFATINIAIFKGFTGIVFGKNPIDTFLTELTGTDYTGTFEKFATDLQVNLVNYFTRAVTLFQDNIATNGILPGIFQTIGQLVVEGIANIGTNLSQLANFDLSAFSFNIGGVELTGGPELGGKLAALLGESFAFLNNIDFSTPKTIVTTLFTQLFESLKDTVGKAFNGLMVYIFGDDAPEVIQSLKDTLAIVSDTFTDIYNNIESSGLLDAIIKLGTNFATAALEVGKFVGILLAVATAVGIPAILPEIADILTVIIDTIANLLGRIGDFFGAINNALLTGDFSTLLTDLKDSFLGFFGDLFTGFDLLGNEFGDILENIIVGFGNLIGVDLTGFASNISWITDIIGDLIATALGGWLFKVIGLLGKLQPLLPLIAKPFQFLFGIIKSGFTGIINLPATITKIVASFNSWKTTIISVGNTLKTLLGPVFTFLKNAVSVFVNFAIASFKNLIISVLGFVAGVTTVKNGVITIFNEIVNFFTNLTIPNPFDGLYNWMFGGEDSFEQQTLMFGLNAFDGYFATASVINPLAFFDEVLPALKITLTNFPTIFDGYLADVNISNPFDALNTFLFGEDGLAFNLDSLGDDFLSIASTIADLIIIDPFEIIQFGLDLIKTLIPEVSSDIDALSEIINNLTISDIFEAISVSLGNLVQSALDFLGIDFNVFTDLFAPAVAVIDDVKQKFNELRQAFIDTANLIPGIDLGDTEITGVEVAQNKIKEAFGGENATLSQKLDIVLDDTTVKQRTTDLLSAFESSYRENSNMFATDFAAINADLIKAGFTADEIASIASNAGISVQAGFAEGFSDNTETTTRAARQLATNTLLELKEALGIQSPSTEARDQIGVFFVQGLLLPFSEVDLLTQAANTFVFNLVTLLNNALVTATTTIQTNITTALFPAFSLSGQQAGDAFVTAATTRLTNADIPVTTSNDYVGQGNIYGKQFGDGLVAGINTSVTQSNGIATIFTNALLNIVTVTTQFSNNIELIIRTLFAGLLQQTTLFFAQLLKEWKDQLSNILALVEGFIKSFNKLFDVFYAEILDNLDTLFDKSTTQIDDFISTVLTDYLDFTDELVKYTKKGIDDIILQFKRLLAELVPIVTSAIAAVKKAFETLTIDFDTIGKNAVAAFILQMSLLYEQTEIVLDLFLEQLLLKYSTETGLMYVNATLLGVNFIDGWINGLTSRLPTLLLVVTSIAEAIINTTKTTLNIQSPSRVMFTMGQYTIDGLSNGITSKIGLATRSMESVVNAITNSRYKTKISDFMKKDVFGTINKTIVPELMLSGKSAQNMLIDLARQPAQSFGNADYNKLVSNNMSNSTTNYTTNNHYNMAINTKPDKTIGLRRQFRTMEFIGVR